VGKQTIIECPCCAEIYDIGEAKIIRRIDCRSIKYLEFLDELPGALCSDMMKEFRVSSVAISNTMRTLEGRGIVKRISNPGVRNIPTFEHYITEKGEMILELMR